MRSTMKILGVTLSVLALAAVAACGSGSPRLTAPILNVPYSQTDVVVGTGTTATSGHMVQVSYTGWLYDESKADFKGKQFDTSSNFGFIVGIGSVIKGWDQGIPGMKVGGTRTLVVPPSLGYGSAAAGPIPANSTLLFEVKLLAAQ